MRLLSSRKFTFIGKHFTSYNVSEASVSSSDCCESCEGSL